VSRSDYLERLAKAFRCSANDLVREMQKRMLNQNFVLIHPPLDSDFDDQLLISYYTEWLPALLREARPQMRVKCIQPVEWRGSAGSGPHDACPHHAVDSPVEDEPRENVRIAASLGCT
jgi:hypothetical protein